MPSSTVVPSPAALPPIKRLRAAIRDPQIAAPTMALVQLALRALGDLHKLDDSLYERFKEGEGKVADDTSPDLVVRGLIATTFGGTRVLVAFCQQLHPKKGGSAQAQADGDFAFGDLEGAGASKPGDGELELGAGDIGDLLEGIDEHQQQTEVARFAALKEKLSSIEYGLSSQLDEMRRRVRVSLSSREISQAIEVLDDTQGSTSEGVLAVLSSVCEAFLPDLDPAALAPGHHTTLGRALLVRRALADLARAIAAPNATLQGEDEEALLPALEQLREALATFMAADALGVMRPADRWQLTRFERSLREQEPGAAKFTSEGLAKYLESLGSINRREVLVLHDQRATAELREALASAQQLVQIVPRLALEPAQKAIAAALSLYGRSPETDEAISALGESGAGSGEGHLAGTFALLEKVVQASRL